MQEKWVFNNKIKQRATKTTHREKQVGRQAENCLHSQPNTKKNNGSAQDYRHQEARETNEGNEGDTGGATEIMIK